MRNIEAQRRRKKSLELLDLYARLNKERYESLGKRVIAVLGSFDTWPYMGYVAEEISKLGHYVVTSIREYFTDENGNLRWKPRDELFKSVSMRKSLRFMIFKEAHEAMIIYSVPGAHYIETEWCYERLNKDPNFQCYGIALVRKIKDERTCSYLQCSDLGFSECVAKFSRTAWECIEEGNFCPFKEQGIAKNVIEYFFSNRRMRLFAVERLKALPGIFSFLF